ncbi:hypothetical protein Plhal304r1_c035g0108991 [Plasmopara halstedii]
MRRGCLGIITSALKWAAGTVRSYSAAIKHHQHSSKNILIFPPDTAYGSAFI